MSNFLKKKRILLLSALILNANLYAYDFSGVYSGKKNIIKLKVNNNQVQEVYVKCSKTNCDMDNSTKSLLMNHGTTLVTELKPLGDDKSIAYTTLILTPTNNHDQIQAALIGYRDYLDPIKNDPKYKVEFTTVETLQLQ